MKKFFFPLIFLVGIASAKPHVFKKKEIQVGGKKILVEIAETVEEQQEGLMFRKKIESNSGMLFIFEEERELAFWMKNTLVDLSIGFFDKNGILVDIQEMTAQKNPAQLDIPTYVSKAPAKLALEMNSGWFKKNKIKLGTKISF